MKRKLDYIVVEGPIGVGKTTLAKRLAATFNTELILELTMENPFLSRFYANQRAFALPTQLHFLFQRARQIQSLRQPDIFKPAQIADFLLEKDQLFANLTLDDDELSLYRQVYEKLSLNAPLPDLVIYLQASTDDLMRRIFARGYDYERGIDRDYLQRVNDAYIEFFHYYNGAPLLIINTHDFDLVGRDKEYELLLEHMQSLSYGKHYLNPGNS